MISFVWAQDQNGLIGKDGALPWYLPNDLKHFKRVTLDGKIAMGRKTYESFPKRPLPERENLILSRNKNYQAEGAQVFTDKEDLLAYAKESGVPLYIIGGASIYKNFLPQADRLIRTVIQAEFEGDTYMPKIDYQDWELVASKDGLVDEKNPYPHRFEWYEKKK